MTRKPVNGSSKITSNSGEQRNPKITPVPSLFRRILSLFHPAPPRQPRFFIDASTFDPQNERVGGEAVIILACNEEATISARVAQAMKHAPGVVVLDQGSHDSTPYLAAQAGAIVILQEPGQSSAAALQKAMQVARQISPDHRIVRS